MPLLDGVAAASEGGGALPWCHEALEGRLWVDESQREGAGRWRGSRHGERALRGVSRLLLLPFEHFTYCSFKGSSELLQFTQWGTWMCVRNFNPSKRCRDISLKMSKLKFQPCGGARVKVRGSPDSVRFILWGSFVKMFPATIREFVEIFQLGQKQWNEPNYNRWGQCCKCG